MGDDMSNKRSGIFLVLIPIILFIIGLSGCVEHHYLYKFNVDGYCDFTYTARGDSLDIYEPQASYPDTLLYHIDTWTERDSSGTENYVLKATVRFHNDQLPRTLSLKEAPWGDVLLRHPAGLNSTSLFFLSTYKFQCVFRGRQRMQIEGDRWDYIPEECRILDSDSDSTLTEEERAVLEEKFAAGVLIWNTERYKLRIREILERSINMHPDIQVPQSWVDSALVEADALIGKIASNRQMESLDFADLEWWDEIEPQALPILLENLNFIGDSTLQAEIANISELLEFRHQVSEDLVDESFEVQVEIPGKLLNSNTEIDDDGLLLWEFTGEDLSDDDIMLSAFSVLIFTERIAGFLIIILASYLAIRIKRRGKEKVETPEPPQPPGSTPPMGHG
ncbi:hypothetical protein CEE37_09180 [candidate division LCP-89 bacterium B3_LCP]|uniref:Uncharacterized protein n=1 Tax=candidate division LCP-89 bacterium B3_LCP TaxID=2012998 RepID=A0A532UZT9_UNCL8|nr:MAG: hypothetical protein CEE37_09180 [candidate division LCP-89 bacterium B3_LCP]